MPPRRTRSTTGPKRRPRDPSKERITRLKVILSRPQEERGCLAVAIDMVAAQHPDYFVTPIGLTLDRRSNHLNRRRERIRLALWEEQAQQLNRPTATSETVAG
jgi:hypothetical protein